MQNGQERRQQRFGRQVTERPRKIMLRVSAIVWDGDHFIHLFLLSTIVHSIFYDNCAHPHISEIYQLDKYGVVINYASISGMRMVEIAISAIRAMFDLSDRSENSHRKEERKKILDHFQLFALLTFMKIAFFNYIFKHNTDDTTIHSIIHILCVILLGVASILSTIVLEAIASADTYIPKKLGKIALSGAVYLLISHYLIFIPGLSPTFVKVLNFFSVVSEGLCAQETI